MKTHFYSTNLRWERERTIYHAFAIWICGNRIQIANREPTEIYNDFQRVIKILRKTHYDWLMERNSSQLNDESNTFYIEVNMGEGVEKVPVDHIGVTDRKEQRHYEIHGACSSYVTRTHGLRDAHCVWSHKLVSLVKQMANRYKLFEV